MARYDQTWYLVPPKSSRYVWRMVGTFSTQMATCQLMGLAINPWV